MTSGEIKKVEQGIYEIEGYDENGAIISKNEVRDIMPGTQWRITTHDATRHGTDLLTKILPGRQFPYPKSLYAVHDGAVDKRSTREQNYGKIRAYGGGKMQLKLHMVTIEDLVPKGHFLRKLDAVLDLGFVYEETAHLYSQRYGRPPIDPVVLVKYLLVGFLYGIPSERQIEQRIQTDMTLRDPQGRRTLCAVDWQRPRQNGRISSEIFRKNAYRRFPEDLISAKWPYNVSIKEQRGSA